MVIPPSIQNIAHFFDKIPGIGPRAALRYAFWLTAQPKSEITNFINLCQDLVNNIQTCQICGSWSEKNICQICQNPHRDNTSICVVAHNQDIKVIEDANVFHGKYHVLNGLIDPIKGRETENIKQINKLINRLQQNPQIKEVILALDPDVTGDTTALYISKKISNLPLTITRLARGIPTGSQIEYADESTIADAYFNRKK